jgi:hypothetical protein
MPIAAPSGITRAACRSTRRIVHNRTVLLDWATIRQAIGIVLPRYTIPTQTMHKQFHTSVVSRLTLLKKEGTEPKA